MLERARAATGLDDFGDASFREGLGILLDSLDREARLTETGQAVIHAQIADLLANRLRIEAWYRLHPEIDEQEIVAPLIGLGLPRTGSTALSCMLAQDPAVRSLRSWEANNPCPPPETATEHTDPRIAVAQQRIDQQLSYIPRMRSMLPQSAESPTECQNFMGYDFKSQLFCAFADIPSYREWLCHVADLVPTYRYVKRVLKLLQWRCPPHRWRLKNPSHSMFISALAEVFPDARFWMTHRDVASVIPSVSALYLEIMRPFAVQVGRTRIGNMNIEFWELTMQRLIAFRDAGNNSRYFDIYFAPLQSDPIGVVADLYRFLGETLTAEARARMEAWHRNTPHENHGGRNYDAANFSLDLEALRRRFGFYSTRFDVPA
jgi:Sulfotransferase family